jgi:hypothetical protein
MEIYTFEQGVSNVYSRMSIPECLFQANTKSEGELEDYFLPTRR